jgi:hypothetical protein
MTAHLVWKGVGNDVATMCLDCRQCTDSFIANWVARFGVSATVTTDRGTQFTFALWTGPACAWASSMCSPLPTTLRVEHLRRQLVCGGSFLYHHKNMIYGFRPKYFGITR